MTRGPLFRMVEPNPKRPRLEIGALKRDENVKRSECLENGKRNEKVDVPRFECPLCMSTSEIPGKLPVATREDTLWQLAKTAASGGEARSCALLFCEQSCCIKATLGRVYNTVVY